MIFNRQGVPLREVLVNAALAREEKRRERAKPVPRSENYRILRDKLGNVFRCFRAVFKDTRSGPWNKAQENARRRARLVVEDVAAPVPVSLLYATAVTTHGSQRKAAEALGISLGKLQRELRKAA